jgi:hypothetical protein
MALAWGVMEFADAYSLRQVKDALPNVFHRRSVFRLHRDEAVGNHCSQKQRNWDAR